MFLNIVMILAIISLVVIAVFDDLTATIPHTITIVLLVLGVLSCIADKTTDYALVITITLCIFASTVTLFFLLKEGSIGGGDVKIMTISFLFLHSFNDVMVYCLLFGLWNIVAYIHTKFILKEKHCRLGRYLGLALVGALMPDITSIVSISLLYIVTVEIIDSIFKRGKYYVEKDFKLF